MLLFAFSAVGFAQTPDTSRPPSASQGASSVIEGDALYELLGTPIYEGPAARFVKTARLRKTPNAFFDFSAKGAGVCLAVSDIVTRVRLHDQDEASYDCPAGRYEGTLPFGVRWGMGEREVAGLLGEPHVDDGWGAYWHDGRGVYVHAAYDAGGGLDTLDISHDSSVPTAVNTWFRNNAGARVGRLRAGPGNETQDAVAEEEDEYSIYRSLSFDPKIPPAEAPPAAVPPAEVPRKTSTRLADLLLTPSAPPVAAPATKPVVVPPTVATPVVATPAGPRYPSLDSPVRTGAKAPNESAVVIGLEDYPFLGSGVPSARRDADAFDDLLVYTRGVPMQNIQTLKTGAREQILAAVERAASEAGKGGTVWVYFAGHGAANPRTGERMLLGDDVRADLAAFSTRGVGVSEIEQLVRAAGAKPLLVLDTCYVGAGRSGASIVGGTRLVVPAYALAPQSGGANVGGAQWNAAGPDQISGPLPDTDHGAFTYYAVGALRGWADGELDGTRDRKVTAAEAQAYVARALRRVGKNEQRPVYVGPDDLVLSTGATELGPAF
ncbi:MAG: caspase family protein [Myxococcota bacterium]